MEAFFPFLKKITIKQATVNFNNLSHIIHGVLYRYYWNSKLIRKFTFLRNFPAKKTLRIIFFIRDQYEILKLFQNIEIIFLN